MAKDYQRLWKDVIDSTGETMAVRALADILADKEGRTFVLSLSRKDAEFCIDILDRGIAGDDLRTIAEKQAFYVTLRRLAGSHGILPESMMIAGNIQVGQALYAFGWLVADFRRGTYLGHLVAVKTLNVAITADHRKIRKEFCKGVVLWSSLSHPHVLKLVGVYGDMERREFITVSEWMEHGNIMEYTKKNMVNRLELLHGAAQGLKYLHRAGIAHGNLKGANILMSNDRPPRACLADFGFMTTVINPIPLTYARIPCADEIFTSPELLVPSRFGLKDATPNSEADIYAFGLVILQVLTGEIPFRGIRTSELLFLVVEGRRPDKPTNASAIGFSDPLWGLVQRCWDGNINLRPKVAEVVTHLAEAAVSWHGPIPPESQNKNASCDSETLIPDSMQNCPIFGPASTIIQESPAAVPANPEPFDEGVTLGRPLSAGSSEPTAPQALATPQVELGSSMLRRQRQDGRNDDPANQNTNQSNKTSFKFTTGRKKFVSKLLQITTPSRKTKTDASSTLQLSSILVQPPGHLSLCMAEIITESKKRPYQELIDGTDKVPGGIIKDRNQNRALNALRKMCSHLRSILKATVKPGMTFGGASESPKS